MPAAPKQDFRQEFKDKQGKFMTNGTANGEEEFEKSPAVEADLKDMDKRKRVSYILNSDAFRKELEGIVDYQLTHGPHPASVMALQHLADMLLPGTSHSAPKGETPPAFASAPSSKQPSMNVPPIADLRGADASAYSKGERLLRCKLASLFRLVQIEGWAEDIRTHISARLANEGETILINPSGLQYQEVSASTLVKLDHHGNIVHGGSTGFGVNKYQTALHTAIHQARPDAKCVLHLHQPDVQAVSMLKCGFMKMCLESCILGAVPTHEFHGVIGMNDDKAQLVRDLGAVNKVMLLSNQGAVICGASVEETWQLTSYLVHACKVQLRALQCVGGNADNLVVVSEEAAERSFNAAWSGNNQGPEHDQTSHHSDKHWLFGEMHFEAKMRELDNAGLRTGYIYKNPLVKLPSKPKSEVEVPAASSSMGYFSDSEALRSHRTRNRFVVAGGYERIEAEVLSDGDIPNDSKARVKWVRGEATDGEMTDGEGTGRLSSRVYSGKHEMKAKIGTMKDDRDLNKSNPGHYSRILEGLSQNDARRYQEIQGVNANAVLAFSKGIIQREHQADAVLLTDYSAPNPFEAVTDDEVETYRKQAERRAKGLPAEDPPAPPTHKPRDARSSHFDEKTKAEKKNRAQTMPAPAHAPGSPVSHGTGQMPAIASDTETGGMESGIDRGVTTGGETETEGGTLDKRGKPAKKAKSFKNPFGGKAKNK